MNKNIFTLLMTVVVVMTIAGCKGNRTDKNTVGEETEKLQLVRTQVLNKTNINRELNLTTTLAGYEEMKIAPSLTGIIQHIYVEVGDRVEKGSDLVKMDENQYKTNSLALGNLKTEFERVEALKKSGNIAQQVYDQTKLKYEQTQEMVDFLKKNTYVKADFAGVITAKHYEDGELYSGQPILELAQISTLKAYISVPESFFTMIKQGMKATITSELYPDRKFDAVVEIVYPTIDYASHTFQVKLKIQNPQAMLRPGMYVDTYLALGRDETLIVPYQSVLKLQGSNERFVFLNDNGVAKRVVVKLGERYDDKVEIISDEIKEGDELVVVGQARLVKGSKLQVENK